MRQPIGTKRHLSILAIFVIAGVSLASLSGAYGQGCIAIRGGQCAVGHTMSMLSGPQIFGAEMAEQSGYMQKGDIQASVGYRWLHSDRHFRGDHEEKQRQIQGTEVINDSHFMDVSVIYAFSPRFSAGLTLPFVYSTRSSLYEHPGAGRNTTSAGGLGDMRLTGYMWLVDPDKATKGNVSFGFGPKFPTGQYDVQDTFQTAAGPVTGTVDQSIQPGDGGWGFSAEMFGFVQVAPRTSAYGQIYYLFNPENENGVSTTTGRPRNAFESVMSIADQYLARAGLQYALVPKWGLSLTFGGRIEGVPAHDFFGRSDGFRRPGYAVSVEPGLVLAHKSWTVNFNTPVAVYRNRTRSVPDIQRTAATGVFRHGDSAFADFVITTSISKQF